MRLLDQFRERARYLHYSLSTEKSYVYWARFVIRWHGMKHPRDMGARSVLTKDEVAGILAHLQDDNALVARLLYGTGMRLMEGLRPRVKDVDFDRQAIVIREAKGNKDRVVMLPGSLAPQLRMQMLHARGVWVGRHRKPPGRAVASAAMQGAGTRVRLKQPCCLSAAA